jgi:hypothetical protein
VPGGVDAAPLGRCDERVLPVRCAAGGGSDVRGEGFERWDRACVQDGYGRDGEPVEQGCALWGGEEGVGGLVEDVEFAEVVRECVVEDGVFGVEPFAVDDVPVVDAVVQGVLDGGGPGFQRSELAFAGAAGEVVAAALELEGAVGGEAEAGVGSVEFSLHDEVAAVEVGERDLVEVFVAGLEAGTLRGGGFVGACGARGWS